MRQIILDTDIGPDCDDTGAMAALMNLQKQGRVNVLGITHCTSDRYGDVVIQAICDWFGYPDIPVGTCRRSGFLNDGDALVYTKPIADAYCRTHTAPKTEDAVCLMRRLLYEAEEKVTLVTIGMLNNLSELLQSPKDERIPLSGLELVSQKADEVIAMAGDFSQNQEHAEFNIKMDIPSARYVAEHCPVPVTYLGWECCGDVLSGRSLESCPPDYPVRMAYAYFLNLHGLDQSRGAFLRESWDPATALYAVNGGDGIWDVQENQRIWFDQNGCTRFEPGGKDRFLVRTVSPEVAAAYIEPYFKG